MKKSRKWMMMATAMALTVLCVGAALAANGDKNDPLVTLSYLEKTVLPGVVKEVDASAQIKMSELEKALDDQIAVYKQEIKGMTGSAAVGSASYTLVTLTKGQTMSLDVGCELMLRVGSATVKAATSPALIDIATGGTINNGTALTKNHLYMSTIPDRTLTPTADTVKLLVRGGYTIA